MPRPRFLDQPVYWTRTPRSSRSRAEEADPIERFDASERRHTAAGRAVLVLVVVAAVLIALGMI